MMLDDLFLGFGVHCLSEDDDWWVTTWVQKRRSKEEKKMEK